MPAAPCSRRDATRAVIVSPLDLAHPRAQRVHASVRRRPARSSRSPLVHVRSRPRCHTPEGGLRHRPRLRSGRRPQPCAPSPAGTARPARLGARVVPVRRPSRITVRRTPSDRLRAGRTDVSRTDVRSGSAAAQGARPTQPARPARPALLQRLILTYQRAMEGRPSPCRFTPSCSAYALEALDTHGTRRGLWLTLRRLVRCRPFGPSGYDPVPLPHDPDPRRTSS